jgi:hypothetical protein
LKDAASSATALTADRSHSKSKAASQSGAESNGSASSSTAAAVQILNEYEATASSQVSEDSKSDAREGDTLESSSSAESSAMSASVASKDAASDEDMADLSQSSVVSAATSSSSASPPSHKTASRKKHHKLSRVDRQLRAVSKLCNADFRDELRSAVHGRSHAPMPKLAAVAAAVVKLREAAELNAEKQKSKESDGGGKRKHAHEAVDLSKFEFGCFDLFGTVDGILWKIFSEIGFVERKAVALVSETEWRHAVMNLVVFADFKAIIVGTSVDSHNDAEAALAHPSLPKGLLGSRVSLVDEFASKDNVNHIISCLTALRLPRQPVHCTDKGMSGSIDLLLMDVGGGMDYWILSQIKEVQPRVVVLKILPEMSTQAIPLVRPYKLDYTSTLRADRGIPILTVASWAKKNGYRVVGCDSDAVHAFLLLDGVGDAVFPSIDLHTCSPKVRDAQHHISLSPQRNDLLCRCQLPQVRSRRLCLLNGNPSIPCLNDSLS